MFTKVRSAGFTLLELIVLIVVFMVALAAILQMVSQSVQHSGDPMFRKQAIAVGESMMEEVMLMSFNPAANAGGRANFNDVFDYQGFNLNPITTIDNIPITGLTGYSLSVTVVGTAVSTLSAANAALITVTVTDPKGIQYALHSYKTNY